MHSEKVYPNLKSVSLTNESCIGLKPYESCNFIGGPSLVRL